MSRLTRGKTAAEIAAWVGDMAARTPEGRRAWLDRMVALAQRRPEDEAALIEWRRYFRRNGYRLVF